MCQELLTTWSMTFSLHWHHNFSAISLCSREEGNEETKLIVMKYRVLWVTVLGRLSLPSCSQQMHFTRPLDWNWTLNISPSLIKKSSFLTGYYFFQNDIESMTESFWISDYNRCFLHLYSEFTIGSIEFLSSCRVQICSFCLNTRSSVVFSSDRVWLNLFFGWIKKDSCDFPLKITVITENTILQ